VTSPKMKPHNEMQRQYARGYYAAHGFKLMHDGNVIAINGRKIANHIACEFTSLNGHTVVNISYRPASNEILPFEKIEYTAIKE